MKQTGTGHDGARVTVASKMLDVARWHFGWKIEKWSRDQVAEVAHAVGEPVQRIGSALLRGLDVRPVEVRFVEGNLLLNEGIQLMLDLLIGEAGTTFTNANAQIGVGTSDTAASASQTGLLGTSEYADMNDGFPDRTAQTVDWQSDFGESDANFAWEEWSIRNGSSADVNLNRKVESLGTKDGGTWTITGSVTIT